MKDLITLIAKARVDYPEQASVRAIGGNNTKILEPEVAKVDIGKVIGRCGRTAHSMPTILGAVSAKIHNRTLLEIVDQKSDPAKIL